MSNSGGKAVGDIAYSVSASGVLRLPSYQRVSAKDAGLKEGWYQELIFAHPELVIGTCRNAEICAGDEQWVSWAREFSVGNVGAIDVLLLSPSGPIAIVETKLAFNPGARREVVAQILNYALALQDCSVDDLP